MIFFLKKNPLIFLFLFSSGQEKPALAFFALREMWAGQKAEVTCRNPRSGCGCLKPRGCRRKRWRRQAGPEWQGPASCFLVVAQGGGKTREERPCGLSGGA